MVATGICVTVMGKDFDAISSAVDWLRGSAVGAGIGTAVTTLAGAMTPEDNRSVGYGLSGVDIICIPAKGPWRCMCLWLQLQPSHLGYATLVESKIENTTSRAKLRRNDSIELGCG